ncbi:uncharacterized protein LOC119261583 isoform X2 [Pygocentrus nattereri]|uniref:uncharacterized protein LOC119261583 isoform X2 n=1 Tax=Pygocentrus nattereri TaxID=42514 RepID=UPI001890CE42|nr:uncharacterized protein LOC119261583 isoform X2 [Pygocentrus nattereri]
MSLCVELIWSRNAGNEGCQMRYRCFSSLTLLSEVRIRSSPRRAVGPHGPRRGLQAVKFFSLYWNRDPDETFLRQTRVSETCETAVATPLTQVNVQTFFLSFEIYRRESVRHLCARPLGVISSYKAHYKGNVDEALSAHGKLRSSSLIRTLPSTPLREGQVDYAYTTPKFAEEHCLGADRNSSTCSGRETLSNSPNPNIRPVITVLY